MRAAIIPTLDTTSLMVKSDYQLALAQELLDDDGNLKTGTPYYNTVIGCIAAGNYVILDNGVAEGEAISGKKLAELAMELHVTEVIAPDVWRDADRSLEATRQFIMSYGGELGAQEASIRIMAVPQGKTLGDWMQSFEVLYQVKEVATIGLPKNLDETGVSRAVVLQMIETAAGGFDSDWPPMKEFHLLGQATWLGEMEFVVQNYPWIRGIDSSYPIALARQGRRYLTHELRDPSVGSFHAAAGADYIPDIAAENVRTFFLSCRT